MHPGLLAPATCMRLPGIVAREIAAGAHGVLTMGQVRAGTNHNIIAAEATLGRVCGALSGIRHGRPHAPKYSVGLAGRGTFPSFLGMSSIPG